MTNLTRWNLCKIKFDFELAFEHVARALLAGKARYQLVSAQTGVPWPVIAVIHEREASQSWRANLAQGDPWDRASIHVPKGIGPYQDWESAAIDALRHPPYLAKRNDWGIEGTLDGIEGYNGQGYAHRGLPSPYLWAGTDQYEKGKFITDGHFDPDAVDHQLGCAGLLKAMIKFDPSITFLDEASA